MSFNEVSEDSVFSFSPVFPLYLPYKGKCQNNGHPEMMDRRWCSDMIDWRWHPDMTEFPSTSSVGSFLSFVLTAFQYIERSSTHIM